METNKSLLEQAKTSPHSEAWLAMTTIYRPMISGWVVRAGIEQDQVCDVTQEVFQALSIGLVSFEHNGRTGAFRSWLKTTTIYRCRRYWDNKKRQVGSPASQVAESGIEVLNQLEDPNSGLSKYWDAEHDRFVLDRIITLVQDEFDPETNEIFRRTSLEGDSASSVANDLQIDIGKVYKSKFRVLTKLRKMARDLVDSPVPQIQPPNARTED